MLTPLREACVKLKLKKCFFIHERVEYLGHIITSGRLSVAKNAKATCAVREGSFPESITQLRSFLGVVQTLCTPNFRSLIIAFINVQYLH